MDLGHFIEFGRIMEVYTLFPVISETTAKFTYQMAPFNALGYQHNQNTARRHGSVKIAIKTEILAIIWARGALEGFLHILHIELDLVPLLYVDDYSPIQVNGKNQAVNACLLVYLL